MGKRRPTREGDSQERGAPRPCLKLLAMASSNSGSLRTTSCAPEKMLAGETAEGRFDTPFGARAAC